jgi:long-chain acyl-CoA synthetase
MRDVSLWKAFEATTTRFAGRTAIEVQRPNSVERWTYRELHDAAVVRARWLAATGIVAGERCAILADNDASWCAAYLAILCGGAVAVPLDTSYSAEEISTIVRDASVRVVFVNERLAPVAREALRRTTGVLVCVLSGEPCDTGAAGLKPSPYESQSSDIAATLYTSGTTGGPKGVVLSHGNLIAERSAAIAVVDVTENDSVLGVAPLFHAFAQLANLLLPLLAGARVVFLETIDAPDVVRALSQHRITIVAGLPQSIDSVHQHVMAEVRRGGFLKRSLFTMLMGLNVRLRSIGVNVAPALFRNVHDVTGSQLRFFLVGGSKLDPVISRDFYALGLTVLQAYGLAEASGIATITVPDDAPSDDVGRALPGQEVRIMPSDDPDLDGEVAIRGPIVMQGYFNRPDATNAVMRDGWLLTGDLGRLDARGRLTITGRSKEVIAFATGTNLYPEEIESCYRKSPFVKEICVVRLARDGDPTTERLYAVVVPDMELMAARRIANAGDLIRFEMEGQSIHLPPEQRVHGYEVWFKPLPRTATRMLKRYEVERRLLQKQRDTAAATAPARGPDEWVDDPHANAVADLLARRANRNRGSVPSVAVGLQAGCPAIQLDSNLEVDLGFDSLERVELLTELEQRFGIKVSDENSHNILTVEQLIEIARPGAPAGAASTTEDPWATLLRDLPPESDPTLGSLLERRPVSGRLFFALLRVLCFAMPRVQATGVDRLPLQGPYIISPNHQSYLDPFFVCAALPYRIAAQLFFVGAAEYFESPITAWLARQCNLVPVDPDANLVPAMKAGAFGLSHGKILVLFPEGERSIDGTVKHFKKGAPILSRHLGVPVVPVAVDGVFAIWPRNRAINWRLLLPWSGHRVRIAFGEPIAFETSCPHGDAAAALRGKVQAMWEALGD